MKLKLLACAAAAGLLLAPFAAVDAQDGASASPPPVAQSGVTLTKTAVQTAPSGWNITLTVQNAGAAAPSVDVVLVADCSRSMADNANGTETSRLAAARAAALQLVDTLAAHEAAVHIGLVGFAGVARTLAPLVAVTGEDGTPEAAGVQTVRAAVESAWSVADESDANGTYGVRGGTNLEQGLRCGLALLQTGSAGAKYLIVLTDGAPTVSGQQQFCDVRDTAGAPCTDSPQYLPQAEILAQTSAAAQEVLSAEGLTKCFAIGFDTDSVSAYASENAAYSVDAAALQGAFGHVADAMRASLQQPVVTETLGTRFSCAQASVRCTGSGGAEAGVATLRKDGTEIEWRLGGSLPAGGRATLSYTLLLADPQLEGAGRVIPVHGESTFSWAQTLPDGSVQQTALAFPCPTVLYHAGALRVISSGLPNSGAVQAQPRALVTKGAMYQLQEPAAVKGYTLQAVKRNGEPLLLAELAANGWKLPMATGETLVEYVYAPEPSAETAAKNDSAASAALDEARAANSAAQSIANSAAESVADSTATGNSDSAAGSVSHGTASTEVPLAVSDAASSAADSALLPQETAPLSRAATDDAAPPSSSGGLPASTFAPDAVLEQAQSLPPTPDSTAPTAQTQPIESVQRSALPAQEASPPAQKPSPAAGADAPAANATLPPAGAGSPAAAASSSPANKAQNSTSSAAAPADFGKNISAPESQNGQPQAKAEQETRRAASAIPGEKNRAQSVCAPALPDAAKTFLKSASSPSGTDAGHILPASGSLLPQKSTALLAAAALCPTAAAASTPLPLAAFSFAAHTPSHVFQGMACGVVLLLSVAVLRFSTRRGHTL